MNPIVKNIYCRNCLDFPFVKPAIAIGASSLFMNIGLEYLGFSHETNVLTASFSIVAMGGFSVAAICTIASGIISHLAYLGNQKALHEFDQGLF